MQVVSMGRILIVPADPTLNGGFDEAPGIICGVHNTGEGIVNVRVLGNGVVFASEVRASVRVFDTREQALEFIDKTGIPAAGAMIAWWPPRV